MSMMEETDDAVKRKLGEGFEDSATKKSKFDHGGTRKDFITSSLTLKCKVFDSFCIAYCHMIA